MQGRSVEDAGNWAVARADPAQDAQVPRPALLIEPV